DEAHGAVVLGVGARLLAHARCRSTDVEGAHGELRAWLADGLRGDHAGGFAEFDHASGGEVASVTGDADAALRLARQHGTDLHPLDARRLDSAGELFGDLLVDVDD